MKKQTMITLALALTLAMPTLPAFAQKEMSKKEIAEKEKAFKNLQHPWKVIRQSGTITDFIDIACRIGLA